MRLFSRVVNFYWNNIASPYMYAKHIGVNIGKNCFIATKGFSSEPYLITIGNNVQITVGCQIHTHGGGHIIRTENPKFDIFGKVVIEDGVFIGAHSQIMPGVRIGEGALVAAGSIVTKSVPPHTIVAGNPARVICTSKDFVERNNKYNVNTYGLSYDMKKQILLNLPEEKFIKK